MADGSSPDFIGVGASASRYGWWHAMLAAHPQIRSPKGGPLALKFFNEFAAREMEDADLARYHRAFPRRPGTITGEWSGDYLHQAWVPPLLARAAPAAKLLVMLRDPIDCYRELFAERHAMSSSGARQVWMNNAAERRAYGAQLRRLRRFFPPERILVLQSERCRRDLFGEYRRTLRFLEVRDDFVPRRLRWDPSGEHGHPALLLARRLGVPDAALSRITRRPIGSPPARALWPELEGALHATLDREVRDLSTLVADFDLSLWPNFKAL